MAFIERDHHRPPPIMDGPRASEPPPHWLAANTWEECVHNIHQWSMLSKDIQNREYLKYDDLTREEDERLRRKLRKLMDNPPRLRVNPEPSHKRKVDSDGEKIAPHASNKKAKRTVTPTPKKSIYVKSKKKSSPARSKGGKVIPTDLDVMGGRGGSTNKHKGNMLFRDEARKFRVVYQQSETSRTEKILMSQVSVGI